MADESKAPSTVAAEGARVAEHGGAPAEHGTKAGAGGAGAGSVTRSPHSDAGHAPAPTPHSTRHGVALVVGQCEYRQVQPLTLPRADAEAISAMLRGEDMAYDTVTLVHDATVNELADAVLDTIAKLRSGDTLVLFYSGHGVSEGDNVCLLGVDGTEDGSGVLGIEWVLRQLAKHVKKQGLTGVTIVALLNCCTSRTDLNAKALPFKMKRGDYAAVLAYATWPGKAIVERYGGSPLTVFTAALLHHLPQPDPIPLVLTRVADAVNRATGGKQRPLMRSNLTEELVLCQPTARWRPRPTTAFPKPQVRPSPQAHFLRPPRHLTGADATIDAIRASLTAHGSKVGAVVSSSSGGAAHAQAQARTAVISQAVTGLGGVGKTTAARVYASRYGDADNYPAGVFWIPCDDVGTMKAAMQQATARDLEHHLLSDRKHRDEACAYFLNWLAAQEEAWLLVLDNVDDPEAVAEHLPLPSSRHGHVLVTSRCDGSSLQSRLGIDGDASVVVGCLPPDQAALLLLRRARDGEVRTEASVAELAATDSEEHAALLKLAGPDGLDGLALALEWVGVLVHDTWKSFRHMWAHYEQHHAKVVAGERHRREVAPEPLLRLALVKHGVTTSDDDADEVMRVLAAAGCKSVRQLLLVHSEDECRSIGLSLLQARALWRLRGEVAARRVAGSEAQDGHMTLAALWSASLELLSAPARALCRMAAYFPPRLILEEVWGTESTDVSSWDHELRDRLADASTRGQRVGRLVSELARQHLVTRFTVTGMELCASPQAWGDDGSDASAQFAAFSMHRLVQEVVREEADTAAGCSARDAALSASVAMGTRHVRVRGETAATAPTIDIKTPLLALVAAWHAAKVVQHPGTVPVDSADDAGAGCVCRCSER